MYVGFTNALAVPWKLITIKNFAIFFIYPETPIA